MRKLLQTLLCLWLFQGGSVFAQFPRMNDPTMPPLNPRVIPSARKSVEIGNFYLKRKVYRGALSRFKEAARLEPDYAPAFLGLGRTYEQIGAPQKALEAYRTYLNDLPSEKQADEAKAVHKAIRRLQAELKAGRSNQTRHPTAAPRVPK